MSDTKPQDAPASANNNGESDMLVIDIGKKQKRKRIRQLRKGRGRLFERISDVVDDLRAEGAVDAKATPIVIVVRERSRGGRFRF